MRVTTSIAVLTAGLANLAASQSFDNYDRCADAIFADPNLGTCASNPGTSALVCFCTSDITGHNLTDATIALCARNHFPVESLKTLICNPNTHISTSDRKHSSSPMVRLANDAHQARALPESSTTTGTDTNADTETTHETAHSRKLRLPVDTRPSRSNSLSSSSRSKPRPSGVSPQHGSAAVQSSSGGGDILAHATPSTSATGASGSEKVVATSSAIMPSGTDSSDGEGEQHGILFQGGAERGVRLSVGAVVGGLVVGVLGVMV
ncbi:hypothetical protein P168DRAFT_301207 [Aspergillus campestris IBT 28561]|uniref:Extracellular membrane protein CFEM domain-containing protein n=1 Tax=Aspergillus campestris (strain IBT 28561) TaxID=1392248 RepID=A0A2I1DF61_ASPC2|nr:uncharacterized protein P168DRAFT_301207 [Aspergillus campestris IBT 28561]PKY08522.1 hypothetical protein P168DRAFT_301207 [Aspergillus campestris IBT 28561]